MSATRRTHPALVFAAAAYASRATMLGTMLPTPLYARYKVRFGFSELIVTVIFATYALGVIAALITFGSVSDGLGRRPVLLLGLAFSAMSAVVFFVAASLDLLLVGLRLGLLRRDLHRAAWLRSQRSRCWGYAQRWSRPSWGFSE